MSKTSVDLWRDGRLRDRSRRGGLLFGRMFEDMEIERSILPAGGRILSIGSAGCTAFALARGGADVVAVDVNPRQIEYIGRRLSGGEIEQGRVDRLLSVARRAYPIAGIRESDLRRFLMMENPAEQTAFWRERIYTPRARLLLDLLLGPVSLGLLYAPRYRGAVHVALHIP